MVVAPHHLASTAGLRVLQEGGNAIEAMIAAASTIAVVYPHMNGLGGDNFWLIRHKSKTVTGIDACGTQSRAVGRADGGWCCVGVATGPQVQPTVPKRKNAALQIAGRCHLSRKRRRGGDEYPGEQCCSKTI